MLLYLCLYTHAVAMPTSGLSGAKGESSNISRKVVMVLIIGIQYIYVVYNILLRKGSVASTDILSIYINGIHMSFILYML